MAKITINPKSSNSVQFTLSVSGSSENDDPSVRFVIEKVVGDANVLIECHKLPTGKWEATIPTGVELAKESYSFFIEAVVDDYYFKPAVGTLAVEIPVEPAKPVVEAVFADEVEDLPPSAPDVTVIVESVVEDVEEEITHIQQIPMTEVTKPKTKGTLFKRTPDGKPLIPGLPSTEDKINQIKTSNKVKQILSSTK
jgi:hypothetical protein